VLRRAAGVGAAAVFGVSVHVAGTDRAALEAAIGEHGRGIAWREVEPRLEDVFIYLLTRKAAP
jgi:hypothetical protein